MKNMVMQNINIQYVLNVLINSQYPRNVHANKQLVNSEIWTLN